MCDRNCSSLGAPLYRTSISARSSRSSNVRLTNSLSGVISASLRNGSGVGKSVSVSTRPISLVIVLRCRSGSGDIRMKVDATSLRLVASTDAGAPPGHGRRAWSVRATNRVSGSRSPSTSTTTSSGPMIGTTDCSPMADNKSSQASSSHMSVGGWARTDGGSKRSGWVTGSLRWVGCGGTARGYKSRTPPKTAQSGGPAPAKRYWQAEFGMAGPIGPAATLML